MASMILFAFKILAFLMMTTSLAMWGAALDDPSYIIGIQWLLMSIFSYITSLAFGPVLFYFDRAVSAAGIAGAVACIIYSFLGKSLAIILFIMILVAFAIYSYMAAQQCKESG